ncbi:MAG: M20/M25/M40 family metallo-hydrolase, partial [Bacteroidota bacterium]
MSREQAIARVERYFDDGGFLADLGRRVAIPTESQNPDRGADLVRYLTGEMQPSFERLGFRCRILDNPAPGGGPFLLAERIEDPQAVTVFSYGHGDVIRGQEAQWRTGLDPWRVTREGERLYGRGTADNKGQHTINLAAVDAAIAARGRLGFNLKVLIETGEEIGSPGLREVCERHRDALAADVFIASDGPRLAPERATIFLGSRGALNMDLVVNLREGGHHSGNWGGLIANPGIVLAHALATITGPKGEIRVPEWRPTTLTPPVRAALADCEVDAGPDGPAIDAGWGEPGLTSAERVFGWSSFEILAFVCGNPDRPVNAIPPRASAHCQLRYVVG